MRGFWIFKAYNAVLDPEIRKVRYPSSRVVDNTIANTLPCTLGILYFQSLPYFNPVFSILAPFYGSSGQWFSLGERVAASR